MDRKLLSATLVLALVPMAGCIGANDFEPGTDYKPTGNTVHIRMWVADMVQSEIFPSLNVNLWAFCAEPADPNDQYSADAIEYREPQGVVQTLDSGGNFQLDEEQTAKCSVPGPQLRVQQGDTVIVDFVNDHFHPHTIHWHGQFVPWESDGVPGSTQDSVVPGESFRYEFEAKRAGTLWYHCHVDTQFHVMQGLYGVIIVEPQDDKLEPEVDDEYTLVFSNLIRELVEPEPGVTDPHAQHRHGAVCGISGVPGCKNPAITQDADVFMINGVSAPNTFFRDDTLIKIDPGEKLRIRMLNAGPFTTETIHLHGHDMLVTHIDGNPIPEAARYWVDTILIGPGQRYDVVVEGHEGREGIWVMHTHITSRVTNSHQYPGGMLTKLVYEDWLEEQGGAITPYDGVEVPGGVPYIYPYEIPSDLYIDETFQVEADVQQEGPAEVLRYEIPVEMPCAVFETWVEVEFNVPASQLPLLGDIRVSLTDRDGTAVTQNPLVPDENGEVRFLIEDTYTNNWDGTEISDPEAVYQVRDMPMVPGNLTLVVESQDPSGALGLGLIDQMEVDLTALVDYYATQEQMQYYATYQGGRDTCEEVAQPGYQLYPPQVPPPRP